MTKVEKQWTIIDLVNWTTEYFQKKGIDSPRLNIELMICSLLNISRVQVYTYYNKPLIESELVILRGMVNKRAEGIPLQYILGKTEFCGIEILVNDTVMIPRPETELLVKAVFNDFPNEFKKYDILDIGSGTGCISFALARYYKNAQIIAVDNSYFALLTAKNNASNLAERKIQFNVCDILNETPSLKKFDIIVSNPPYIPIDDYKTLDDSVRRYEPRSALTDERDGLTFYRRYAKIFNTMLKPEGRFYLEIGYNQQDTISEIFKSQMYDIDFENDLSGITRIIKGKLLGH